MEDWKIEVGDKVTFYFGDGLKIFGDVLSKATQTGECWVVQSYYEGKKDSIEYIQQFQRISFHPKEQIR